MRSERDRDDGGMSEVAKIHNPEGSNCSWNGWGKIGKWMSFTLKKCYFHTGEMGSKDSEYYEETEEER